jgi:hypothetical protein
MLSFAFREWSSCALGRKGDFAIDIQLPPVLSGDGSNKELFRTLKRNSKSR